MPILALALLAAGQAGPAKAWEWKPDGEGTLRFPELRACAGERTLAVYGYGAALRDGYGWSFRKGGWLLRLLPGDRLAASGLDRLELLRLKQAGVNRIPLLLDS